MKLSPNVNVDALLRGRNRLIAFGTICRLRVTLATASPRAIASVAATVVAVAVTTQLLIIQTTAASVVVASSSVVVGHKRVLKLVSPVDGAMWLITLDSTAPMLDTVALFRLLLVALHRMPIASFHRDNNNNNNNKGDKVSTPVRAQVPV